MVVLASVLAACSGSGDSAPEPVVELIPDAVAAVEDFYGAPQEYFEISADLDGVGVIVAIDDATAAEQGRYEAGGEFVRPEPVGPASGATFTADKIVFDPDRVFDEIRAELDEPVIVDFAVQGGPDGSVIYDATIASDSGGLLRVFVGPDGRIQGVSAQ